MVAESFVADVLGLDDGVDLADDDFVVLFIDRVLELMGVIIRIEAEGEFVGWDEDYILVFRLVAFHHLIHFLSHVGPDLDVDSVVGRSF